MQAVLQQYGPAFLQCHAAGPAFLGQGIQYGFHLAHFIRRTAAGRAGLRVVAAQGFFGQAFEGFVVQVGKEIDCRGTNDGHGDQQKDHQLAHVLHWRFDDPGGDQYGIVPAGHRGMGGGKQVLLTAEGNSVTGGRRSRLQVFLPGDRADAQQQGALRIGDLDASAVFFRNAADAAADAGGGDQVGGAELRCPDAAGGGDKQRDIFRFLSAVLSYRIRGPGKDVFRAVHSGVEILQGMAGVNQLAGEEFFRADAGGRGKTVIRTGTVGDQVIRQGGNGMKNT